MRRSKSRSGIDFILKNKSWTEDRSLDAAATTQRGKPGGPLAVAASMAGRLHQTGEASVKMKPGGRELGLAEARSIGMPG
jgi:hypothetical protein